MIARRWARAAGFAVQLLGLLSIGLLAPRTTAADTDPVLERRVKAAFLYQFIPYIEWPAAALGPPAIGPL